MANARLEELKARFDENPRRYFAPYANELRKTGDHPQAISICRSHLAVQPGHVSGHIVLAQALSETGELDQAKVEFESALELDPENLIALRAMGDIARERGDVDLAREWYQRVLEADPRNDEIARTLRDMTVVPNVSSGPPAAPAPLSMLVADPAPEDEVAAATPPPPVEATPPEPVAAPPSEPPVQEAPSMPAMEPPMPEHESRAVGADQAPDDFVPFDSVDMIGPPPVAGGAPLPEETPDGRLDLSDLTITDDVPLTTAEMSAAPHADGADVASSWNGTDELAVSDTVGPAAPDSSEAPREGDEATGSDWVSRATPAADLSDYEAAPGLYFEEDLSTLESRAASASAGPPPEGAGTDANASFEDDIESWFDTPAVPASPSPSAQHDALEVSEDPSQAWAESVPGTAAEELRPESAEPTSDWTPSGDEPTTRPEPAAATSADPLIGRTPSFVEAVPETPAAPFVTETLAELYLQQGFRNEALAIYRQLLERSPADESLRRRIDAIERGAASDVVPDVVARSSTTGHRASVSVRTFFSRLAQRAPSRPPTGGGPARGPRTTGSWEAVAPRQGESAQGSAPDGGYGEHAAFDLAPARPQAAARATEHAEPTSALASLFAAARPSEADARAASALASAFGEAPAPLSPSGRPSRTAERELSLDHLFRDDPGGGTTAASATDSATTGSLDDFYRSQSPPAPGPGAPDVPGGAPPAPDERGTDLRQFTAWLEGLKKK